MMSILCGENLTTLRSTKTPELTNFRHFTSQTSTVVRQMTLVSLPPQKFVTLHLGIIDGKELLVTNKGDSNGTVFMARFVK